jgi:hypothetical protein
MYLDPEDGTEVPVNVAEGPEVTNGPAFSRFSVPEEDRAGGS